ncbi:MAG: hypothetical protein AAF441_03965 [Pseudomonadota bacterium]
MRILPGLPALFLICLFSFGVGGLAAQEVISAKINMAEPPEERAKAVETLANELNENNGKLILLNLSIASHEGDSKPEYDAKTRGGRKVVRCEQGWGHRFGNDEGSFQFKFSVYNHLLLEIVHKTGVAFPFNHAYCEYDGTSPDAPVLRLKGYFVPSVVTVPQAFDILLVPVKP